MLILFIVIVFLNILYFKKSFNNRDNKDIIMFFSLNFFSKSVFNSKSSTLMFLAYNPISPITPTSFFNWK